MVRMSDILRRAKEKERKAKEEQKKPLPEFVQQGAPPEPVKPEPVKEVVTPETKAYEAKRPEVGEQKEEKAEISEVRISSVVMKGAKIASSEESMRLYEGLVSLMREILKENIDYKSIEIKRFAVQVERIVVQLSLGNEKMLVLPFNNDSRDEDYLPCHSVNVCIFSIEMGIGLGYEKSKLMDLGISSLLHDVGMTCYLHLSNQQRKLTAREHNEIKNHPIKGSEILERIENLNKIAIYVAHQQHERIDGSGYPRGLKEESINEYAKIVGLVDEYEALSHVRSYRKEFSPLETIGQILADKNSFKHKLIKILIERLGIFPVGSFVRLNNKEIARVINLNHIVPLRPVVKIIYNPDGEKPKETKRLDLSSQPTIYIKEVLRKNELSE